VQRQPIGPKLDFDKVQMNRVRNKARSVGAVFQIFSRSAEGIFLGISSRKLAKNLALVLRKL
jgi:hypothetical protein